MVAPLRRRIKIELHIKKLQFIRLIEYRCIVPVLPGLISDLISLFLHQRIEHIVHVFRIFLQCEHVRCVIRYQPRELRPPDTVARVLPKFPPNRRNRVLAVIPDVVVQDAQVRTLRHLILPPRALRPQSRLRIRYRNASK